MCVYIYTHTHKHSLRTKLLLLFRKFNFLKERHLICSLLIKNVQAFKTTLINLNYREKIVLTF